MKTLVIATSYKPPNYEDELKSGQRYRLEYLELSKHLGASYMDYEPPWMHQNQFFRQFEETVHMDIHWSRKIAKIVDEQEYDLIISMSERIAVPIGRLLNRHTKHIAILINTLSPKWLFAIKSLGVHRRWNKIVTYSHAEANALGDRLSLESNKVIAIHNYVDTEFFKVSNGESSTRTDKPFIISQGLAKRDYPTLIEAMSKLPFVECQISAVSAWDKFEAGYEGLKIPGNVILKDYDHPSLIREMFAQCRFLVIPLKPDTGMWCSGSTSVLQAQAMGKPVIVTNLPGVSEYVLNNESGFIVDGNDPTVLAEKIGFLWKNPDRAEAMGKRGQAWVREHFSLNNWINGISEVVEDLK